MFNLKYLLVFVALAAFAVSAMPALAQTTEPIRGVVKLRAKDGTETPVAGTLVESYRTDLGKGAGNTTTTNKKGEFSFVGFQLGAAYALAVSGPGIRAPGTAEHQGRARQHRDHSQRRRRSKANRG